MKRYMLFASHCHYPEGGFYDFRGSYDSVQSARRAFGRLKFPGQYVDHWGQIVDSTNFTLIGTLAQCHPGGDINGRGRCYYNPSVPPQPIRAGWRDE